MAITSFGRNVEEALEKSFSNAEKVKFHKKYYRRDIGFDIKQKNLGFVVFFVRNQFTGPINE